MHTDRSLRLEILLLSVLCLGASGCATITTGTTQSVSVITEKGVTGAKCELTDSLARRWFIADSPGTVEVRKGDGPMRVVCEKEGYETADISVEEVVAGATLGNVILGGGIGLVVDSLSGAAQRYPEEIVLWMRPEEWESEEQRLEWEEAKRQYEAKLAAEAEERRKALEQSQKGEDSSS